MQFTYDKNQPMRKNKFKLALVGSALEVIKMKGKGGEFTSSHHSSIQN